jgi:hypothetical protein
VPGAAAAAAGVSLQSHERKGGNDDRSGEHTAAPSPGGAAMIGHGWQVVDGAGARDLAPTTFVPRERMVPRGSEPAHASGAAERRLRALRAGRRVERARAALRALRAGADEPARRGVSI